MAQRARHLVRLHGASWFVALVCFVALCVGTLDYWLRFEDVGVRLICFAMVAVTMGVAFGRLIVVAWRYRCTDLHAAQRIEERYPILGDRLSSAVAFATDLVDDDLAGSLELRRAVVTETETAAEPLDFHRCIDRRRPVAALLAASCVVLVIGVLGVIDGPSVALAAKRLLVPWSDVHWPRRHVLELVHPVARLAVGQDFEIEVADAKGHLPEHVDIHYWFDGDALTQIQTYPMQSLGEKMFHRMSDVTRSFRYRVTGGDDQAMPWHELTLVEPPKITRLEITLHPPEYTGFDPRPADGGFHALVGTHIALRARTDRPLSAASLETDTVGSPVSIPLALQDDRCGFSLGLEAGQPWTIAQSGSYGLRLVDREGLDVGVPERWEVEAIKDLPPTVSLKVPASDLMITPHAQLPIEAIVKDDLALRRVELHFKRLISSQDQEQSFPLWQGPDHVTPESAQAWQENGDGVHLTVDYAWDLTELPSMKPGERIDFRLTADDYRGETGESIWRRLTIISAEELEERIAQRQAEILAQVAEILKLQSDTHVQTSELQIQAREVGSLARRDIDLLQVVELNQRQVQQRLGHPVDGVGAQISSLVSELQNNRIDRPDLLQKLAQFRDTIAQLNDLQLPPVQHDLIDALKIAREDLTQAAEPAHAATADGRELARLFEQATQGQQAIIATLEALLGQFAQWDNFQRLAREVGRLKREQEEVHDRTAQLRLETLTKDFHDLTTQQRVNLKRLAERQNDLALRFNALTSSMEASQQKLLTDQPAAAATLADAVEMARNAGIGGQIRDVGRELDQNRLGQAAQQQEEVVQLLGELQDILANRRQSQLDRQVQELHAVAERLAEVRDRHEAVRQSLSEELPHTPAQLRQWGAEETDLSDRTSQLARRSQRLDAGSAAQSLQAAASHLQQAGEACQAGDETQMRDKAEQARQQLEDAQRQLQGAMDRSQQQVRSERLARLRQTVSQYLSRQQRLSDDTRQVESQRQVSSEPLADELVRGVTMLADEQAQLGREVDEVADTLTDTQAFAFALQQTAGQMQTASSALNARDTGQTTQRAQQQATDTLQQLLTVLMDDMPREPADLQPPQQPSEKPARKAPPPAYLLSQLRLVRALQLQINQQTATLAAEGTEWNEEQTRRHGELVHQQDELSQLVLRLLEQPDKPAPPAEAPPAQDQLDSLEKQLQRDADQ